MKETQSPTSKVIPTQLTLAQFNEFVLPSLTTGTRGPRPKLDLYKIFNYILKFLYMGCQRKELPIEKDKDGVPEIHYTNIYRAFRRFGDQGCIDAIFEHSVFKLHQAELLDTSILSMQKDSSRLSAHLLGKTSSSAYCCVLNELVACITH